MLHFKVVNYRRCVEADFSVDKIALIAGRNSEGKSSLLQACALALTHTPLPYGLTKKDAAGAVVHAGAEAAYVMARADEDGAVKIGWPSSDVETTGKAPAASAYAVGLSSLVNLSDDQRSEALVKLIRADPNKEDLSAALTPLGMKAASIDRIWSQIEAQGWHIALKEAEDARAARKSDFEQITGTRWGSEKGGAWLPEGWTEDLDGATETELEQAVIVARAKADDALVAHGADQGERRHLQSIVDMLPALRQDMEKAETDLQAKAAALVGARKDRDALPSGAKAQPDTCACPACGVVLEMRQTGGGLAPAFGLVEHKTDAKGKPSAKDDAETRKKIASADGALARTTAEHGAAQRKVGEISAAIAQAEGAEKKIAAMDAKPSGSAEAPGEAREALAAAERRARMFTQRRDALQRHRAILNWDAVAHILAPTGLRQKKLAESLDAFNAKLAGLCEAAAWPVVSVTIGEKGPRFLSNGRDYRLTGDNEQFRVRAVLATAHAMIDGSEIVIIDGCDVLDMPSRSGLLKLIEAPGKSAILAMTASLPRNKVPDLAKSGRGATFIIEDGRLRPYDVKKDEVA